MLRVPVLQFQKQQVKGGGGFLLFFLHIGIFDQIYHRCKVLFFRRGFVDQIEHQRHEQGGFRLLPKGVVRLALLGGGVFNEHIYELQHVLVLPDVTKGVIKVGLLWMDEIEHPQGIPLFDQQRPRVSKQLPLGVTCHKAAIGLHEIGQGVKPGFTRAGTANHQHIEVAPVLVGIHSQPDTAG